MNPPDSAALTSHAESLRRLACALVGDPHAADDLVQETYVLALSKKSGKGLGWLRGVLRNKHREQRRAAGRRARREKRSQGPSTPPGPEETAARIDEQRVLMEALKRVAEPYRTAVWMRYFGGQSPAQIARAIGVPAATVRTRVHRGLEALRAELDKKHGDRTSWQLLLLPLVPAPGKGAGVIGGVMAASKTKVVATAAAVALLGLGSFAVVSGMRADEPGTQVGSTTEQAANETEDVSNGEAPMLHGHGDAPVNEAAGSNDEPAPAGQPPPTKGVTIRGRVRLEANVMERRPSVYVIAKDAKPRTLPAARIRVGEDGRFELNVATLRNHWVVASGPPGDGYLRTFVNGDIWEGESLDIVVRRAPERTIRVLGPDGKGRQARLAMHSALAGKPRTWPRWGDPDLGLWTRPTDAKGVVRLRLPTEHAFILRASAPGLVARPRRVQPEETDITIRLVKSATIHVTPRGWAKGDMPLSARLTCSDVGHDCRPLRVGARLDGSLVFDQGVAPGIYSLVIHSPEHETQLEMVHIAEPGETVRLTITVVRKEAVGSAQLVIEDGHIHAAHPAQVQVFWRGHSESAPTWKHRGAHIADKGVLTMVGLPEGRHDFYVAIRGDTRRAGMAQGTWVRDAEATEIPIALEEATMRRMPELGEVTARSWRLVDRSGAELPLFFLTRFGSQSYPGPGLPPAKTTLGPYPEGDVELVVEGEDGRSHTFPLEPMPK